MIKQMMLTYLGMVVAVIIMDFKHLKQAAVINRWLSYGVMGLSTVIWFYIIHLNNTLFVSSWLAPIMRRFLPMP
ncbi:hypothetical protein [Paenibacillus sp. OK003]|uniref:hypothetical protein n=1 Tax=Paenibacillus sp. OK003 TaxID=1884380 RepID=UPI0008BB97D9|nr:hypothetical protein [Paenibacillus sp. OK003]SEK50515.1 hypothetical protein SAMN05518856_102388 [Paenibacillus sp. OK003]